jgi:hypothetical protein
MGPRWDYSNGFRAGYHAGYRRAFASARPGWRGRWDRYGWGGDAGYGERYPDRREDERLRRDDDRDRYDHR